MWAVSGSNPPRCRSHGALVPQALRNAERAIAEARNRITNQHYQKDAQLSSNTNNFSVGDIVEAIDGEAYGAGLRTVTDIEIRPSGYDTITTTKIPGSPVIYFSPNDLRLIGKDDTVKESEASDIVLAKLDKAIEHAELRLQALRDARTEVIGLG